jgi:hypothetical protein
MAPKVYEVDPKADTVIILRNASTAFAPWQERPNIDSDGDPPPLNSHDDPWNQELSLPVYKKKKSKQSKKSKKWAATSAREAGRN